MKTQNSHRQRASKSMRENHRVKQPQAQPKRRAIKRRNHNPKRQNSRSMTGKLLPAAYMHPHDSYHK